MGRPQLLDVDMLGRSYGIHRFHESLWQKVLAQLSVHTRNFWNCHFRIVSIRWRYGLD